MITSRMIAGAPLFGSLKFWGEFDQLCEDELRKMLFGCDTKVSGEK